METGGNDVVLAKALKDLLAAWDRTEATWRDQARADFDRDHLRPLVPSLTAAVSAIQKIEEILRAARKDCS